MARCSRSMRQSGQITPTTSPSATIGSRTTEAGELKGGAGRWQRRHADVGTPGRSLRSRFTRGDRGRQCRAQRKPHDGDDLRDRGALLRTIAFLIEAGGDQLQPANGATALKTFRLAGSETTA